jgi:hypothetical protein
MKIVLISLLLLSTVVYAQKTDSVPARKTMHRFAVKWSPVHLVGYYPTVQLAVEHRIADRLSLQWDAGYVVNTSSVESKDGFDKKGFKAKVDVRYYFPFGRSAVLLAPELYYNYVDYKSSGTYGIDCDEPGGECYYYRYYTYPVRYREPGLNFKGGLFHRFGKHFCIEYHVGLALRFIRYKTPGKPAAASYEEQYENGLFDFAADQKSLNTLFPSTGFRLGYIFK